MDGAEEGDGGGGSAGCGRGGRLESSAGAVGDVVNALQLLPPPPPKMGQRAGLGSWWLVARGG